MTETRKYTAGLSKGQGMIPETLALLDVWTPGMTQAELYDLAVSRGVISRATAIRVQDIVRRVFAFRYLADGGRPARYLKLLMDLNVPRNLVTPLLFIYTARIHLVLHDFTTMIYWPKYETGAVDIARRDALDFIEKSVSEGRIAPRWSDSMMTRVARYLTGCLADFGLLGPDRAGRREILDFRPGALTVLYLAHELHFGGAGDMAIIAHEDWALFGMAPMDVRYALERASQNHFIPQFSGDLMRIAWRYSTMEEALRGIVENEI